MAGRYRRLVKFSILLICALVCSSASLSPPARAAQVLAPDLLPGAPLLTLAGKPGPGAPQPLLAAPGAVKAATFEITYSGLPAEAQAAFQYAADIWASRLTSSVPIKINASWEPLGAGVLGASNPVDYTRNFTTTAVANTWYPIALGNKIARTDLAPDGADIAARFNSDITSWYFGTDGRPGAQEFDFVTVALHDLGHGLGFVGSMDVANGMGGWGWSGSVPTIYDRLTVDSASRLLVTAYTDQSAALATALQSGAVSFSGQQARAANGGAMVLLYAPDTWNDATSYSHLDESFRATPNGLMAPSIAPGAAIHALGPITLAMFADMGWTISLPTVNIKKSYLSLLGKSFGVAGGGPLLNGDFESTTGWAESATPTYPLVTTPPDGFAAHGGAQVAYLGGDHDATHRISQDVTVPAGAPLLSFWYHISSEDFCGYDFAYVQINGVDALTMDLCETTTSTDWEQTSLSLSAYAGQAVTLSFLVTTDEDYLSTFLIDDVTLQ